MSQAKPKKKKSVVGRVFLILLVLILLAFAAAALYYNSILNHLDFADKSGSLISAGESLVDQMRADAASIKEAIQQSGITGIQSGNRAEGEVKSSKNIINVLLIGSDYRIPNTSDPGRADVTMLCSLNKKTGDIKLISFERGIMVEVPGVGTELLTHSFHYGGAELTTQLLRDYFLLDIAGYAHVDFDTFSQLVDAVGGVDIEITDAESYALGVKPGWNHLDGKTALVPPPLHRLQLGPYRPPADDGAGHPQPGEGHESLGAQQPGRDHPAPDPYRPEQGGDHLHPAQRPQVPGCDGRADGRAG